MYISLLCVKYVKLSTTRMVTGFRASCSASCSVLLLNRMFFVQFGAFCGIVVKTSILHLPAYFVTTITFNKSQMGYYVLSKLIKGIDQMKTKTKIKALIILAVLIPVSVGAYCAYGMFAEAVAKYTASSACVGKLVALKVERSAMGVSGGDCWIEVAE